MKILDIGCGKKKYQSGNKGDTVIGLDVAKLPGVDKVHNLEKFPWPFKNNEFDYVYADNILEHLTDIVKPIEEIHRITKNGGIVHIRVPIFPSKNMFVDPTHKSFFTHKTFEYFTVNEALHTGYGEYYSKARFDFVWKKIHFNKYTKFFMNLINRSKILERIYFYSFCYFIPPSMMEIKLKVVK